MARYGQTHGLRNHRFYKVWNDVRKRCTKEHCKDYPYYGGRGIKMQESWLKDPTDFIAYLEILTGWYEGMTLDRIDNNGSYEEGNLRWATRSEQNHNTRLYKTNISGYNGVVWNKRQKRWVSNLTHRGTMYHIGTYRDKIEALYNRNRFIVINKLPHKIQF